MGSSSWYWGLRLGIFRQMPKAAVEHKPSVAAEIRLSYIHTAIRVAAERGLSVTELLVVVEKDHELVRLFSTSMPVAYLMEWAATIEGKEELQRLVEEIEAQAASGGDSGGNGAHLRRASTEAFDNLFLRAVKDAGAAGVSSGELQALFKCSRGKIRLAIDRGRSEGYLEQSGSLRSTRYHLTAAGDKRQKAWFARSAKKSIKKEGGDPEKGTSKKRKAKKAPPKKVNKASKKKASKKAPPKKAATKKPAKKAATKKTAPKMAKKEKTP